MSERQTGVYIGSKIPQLHTEAIRAEVRNWNYLNSSDFVRDAIKEKLRREGYILCIERPLREIGDNNEGQ